MSLSLHAMKSWFKSSPAYREKNSKSNKNVSSSSLQSEKRIRPIVERCGMPASNMLWDEYVQWQNV